RVPREAAEETQIGAAEKLAEIDLAGLMRRLADFGRRKDFAHRIGQRPRRGKPSPAHAYRRVEVARDMFARDQIFRTVNAGADDVANAQRDVGPVPTLFDETQFHPETAVVVILEPVIGEVAIAERTFQPRQRLEAEAVTLRVL